MNVAGRVVALGVVVLVATSAGVAVQGGPISQQGIDADTTILAADIGTDGTADFRVTYRIELDDENTTQAFEDLQQDIEANTSQYLGQFRDRIEATVADAENATGREMSATNFSVEVRTESQPDTTFGVVTYRFEWVGFAAVDGQRIRAGDALDQFIIDSGTVLRFSWPADYGTTSVVPEPTTREPNTVIWRGPRDFDAGEPRVVLEEGVTPTDGDGGGAAGGGGLPMSLVLVVLVLGIGAGAWLYVRSQGEPAPVGDDGESAAGAAGGTDGDDGPPPELLSNEERVLRLLEDNGGRMKQKEVADELDWTAAKTSQVVGDLREADEVESFRLGRENVLTLPDVDIDAGADDENGE